MKTTFLLLAVVLPLQGARCQPEAIQQIELSKVSRGYEEHVRVDADSLHVLIEDRKDQKRSTSFSRKVTAEEWTSLVKALGDLPLNDVSTLPSPTMKRAYDGAMHATITINAKDGQSYSHGYDDEAAHEALQPLRKAIRDLSNINRH